MRITQVHIEGFRRFTEFDLELDPTFNILVGDNETGKSSLLNAIELVVTGQYDGRLVQYAIDPYMFNAQAVARYFTARRLGQESPPPRVLVEAYFESTGDDSALEKLRGSNNTKGEDCPGLVVEIELDSNYVDALKDYAADDSNPAVLPVEFFKSMWRSFAGTAVTLRTLPFRVSAIDTSHKRVYRGPDKYLSQVASEVLDEQQRRKLSLEYKKLQHRFTQEPGVKAVNDHLVTQGNPATARKLTIQMDMSARTSWDNAMTAHLDDLPFDSAGKGEQCKVHLRLAIAGAGKSQVILIEEPENHLSHSNLSVLMDDIVSDCVDQQVIVATHSAYVLNKLGVDNLRLVSHAGQSAALHGLTPETKVYFMKLPGYDTLRLILSKRSILVEGPSDELIVQSAYKAKRGRLPLQDGVDVISVGSLAFKRFLEIAKLLDIEVGVVTDNDADVAALEAKYAEYLNGESSRIRIYYDTDESCDTLEPQLLKANSLEVLNEVFETSYSDPESLLKYMARNKTDCALKVFESEREWVIPRYIDDAIAWT